MTDSSKVLDALFAIHAGPSGVASFARFDAAGAGLAGFLFGVPSQLPIVICSAQDFQVVSGWGMRPSRPPPTSQVSTCF
jgi:hypothetical protein